ncbi:signal peptidase I [bacterium]|nr:signal peptidase I [bacterium]
MSEKPKTAPKKNTAKKSAFREYSESLIIAVAIALVIRALVIYPFRIPTGSMESSLLIGDFLLANKFVYGIRTPDWIGIPYTTLGFRVPFWRTPGFREPERGDVVIFKYPRDDMKNYIKRCIAVSGDTVEVIAKTVYVNGEKSPLPPHAQFIRPMYTKDQPEPGGGIYPPDAGNRDFYGPVVVPAPGDTFHFTDENRDRWFEWLQIMLYEGRRLQVGYQGESRALTLENQYQWPAAIQMYPASSFSVDGHPLDTYVYTVTNKHYFMMGDNRDNSLDSRYWGYLPERFVVGEGLIVYWSWDGDLPLYRLFNKVRWNRILTLIR